MQTKGYRVDNALKGLYLLKDTKAILHIPSSYLTKLTMNRQDIVYI